MGADNFIYFEYDLGVNDCHAVVRYCLDTHSIRVCPYNMISEDGIIWKRWALNKEKECIESPEFKRIIRSMKLKNYENKK